MLEFILFTKRKHRLFINNEKTCIDKSIRCFVNILTIPQNAITTQYSTLLAVDNIDLQFTKDAIAKIAEISADLNATSEDIGARRLHTVMENLVEDISFNAGGDHPMIEMVIDENYVVDHMPETLKSQNLKKYIL